MTRAPVILPIRFTHDLIGENTKKIITAYQIPHHLLAQVCMDFFMQFSRYEYNRLMMQDCLVLKHFVEQSKHVILNEYLIQGTMILNNHFKQPKEMVATTLAHYCYLLARDIEPCLIQVLQPLQWNLDAVYLKVNKVSNDSIFMEVYHDPVGANQRHIYFDC